MKKQRKIKKIVITPFKKLKIRIYDMSNAMKIISYNNYTTYY